MDGHGEAREQHVFKHDALRAGVSRPPAGPQAQDQRQEPLEIRRSFIDQGRALFQALSEEMAGVSACTNPPEDNDAQTATEAAPK